MHFVKSIENLLKAQQLWFLEGIAGRINISTYVAKVDSHKDRNKLFVHVHMRVTA